jgi:SNF2 family DNA or RNA helicase
VLDVRRVSVALGQSSDGQKLALFTLLQGSSADFRKLLSPFGRRNGTSRNAGYLVRLDSAYRACGALQKHGAELQAKKDVPGVLKASSWKCSLKGLYPHQTIAAEYLRSRRRALLADQMGVGKSASALAAIDATKGTLIVVPSVVVGNWYNETRRWRRDLTVRVWREPYSIFPDPGEVNLIPYSQLPHESLETRTHCSYCGALSVVPLDDVEILELAAEQKPWRDKCDPERGGQCKKADGTVGMRRFIQGDAWPEWVWVGEKPKGPIQLVVDEAHYCKTKDAQRTIAVRTIATQCSSVWLLTGTPLLNSPPELWSLCQLFPGQGGQFDNGAWDAFGSWSSFVEMFGGRKLTFKGQPRGYEWRPGFASPEARECLGTVMLRRMRADVLPDLPVKTRRYVEVKIEPRALSKLVTLTENLLLQFKEWSDEKVLEECAAGGALSMIRKELAMLKLPTLIELIKEYEQVQEPVIAFSYHRDPIIQLGTRKGWACITGSTSDFERTALVARFQKGELRGIAGTIGAMGVGVTLTKSANVMFLDRDFVPANNLQAEDRCVRIGQTRGVVVTILTALHAVDERVAIILDRKEQLLDAMDLGEERNESLKERCSWTSPDFMQCVKPAGHIGLCQWEVPNASAEAT